MLSLGMDMRIVRAHFACGACGTRHIVDTSLDETEALTRLADAHHQPWLVAVDVRIDNGPSQTMRGPRPWLLR